MSTKVGLIGEGPIDEPIVRALLQTIACQRAGYTWPVHSDDLQTTLRIRKTGHGGVVEKLRRLLEVIDAGHETGCRFHVVVLDNRKLEEVHSEVRQLVAAYGTVVFGVAIEELEAWWLADRQSVLGWLQLTDEDVEEAGIDYGSNDYHPERDQAPKATLDALTRISEAVNAVYGKHGNLDLAVEFAEDWARFADLQVIEHGCPNGFRPFASEVTASFHRCLREDAQDRGQLPL